MFKADPQQLTFDFGTVERCTKTNTPKAEWNDVQNQHPRGRVEQCAKPTPLIEAL